MHLVGTPTIDPTVHIVDHIPMHASHENPIIDPTTPTDDPLSIMTFHGSG
jgi:hypothetical protein